VKVLLVEDYPVNVKVATKFLSRWEIDFDVAENGLVAVEKYKNGNYDVILMDLLMPEMDGYTATLRIRELNQKYLLSH
jgi:CheY-like chemotaxis protein